MDKERETVPVDVGTTPEAPFLVDLFSAFNGSNIDYCVLRNYSGLPYDLQGSDLDIALSETSLDRAKQLVNAIAHKHKGFAIWREYNDFIRAYFHCSGICDNGTRWGVHIDLMTAIRWKGLDYYSHKQVLKRSSTVNGVRVANALDATLIAFLDKLLHVRGANMAKEYLKGTAVAYSEAPQFIRQQIEAAFGKQGKSLIKLFETKDLKMLATVAKRIRLRLFIGQIFASPYKIVRNRVKRRFVHCKRILRKMGICVAVLGLDGSGKSTLIGLVRQEIERLFHTKTDLWHYRPRFLPAIKKMADQTNGKTVTLVNPHAKPPTGRIVSLLRLAYCTGDYLLGYWLSVYPLLVRRGTVVFFDRYFYDYYVDPARFQINAPDWVIRFFERFVPRPDLLIMVMPNPETFHERKPELPIEELRRQAKRMQEIAIKLKDVEWIDTSGPIESSRKEMLGVVLERFRRRLAWH